LIAKLKELFEYRDLLRVLTVKELKLQYRNSVLGFFWSLLNPLLMMLIFTFVFAQVFRFGIKDFPVFLLCGLFPWNFFNGSIVGATGSIISNSNLIKKVYFPREILPLSVVAANMVNFVLSMVILFVLLSYYGYNYYAYLPLVALIVIIETMLAAGLSLLLAALNVYFRDIQYIVGVGMMALFYATPIIYNISMVEQSGLVAGHPWILLVYKLNPMVWITGLYKDMLYGMVLPSWHSFGYAILAAVVFLCLGFTVFHYLSPRFAEEV